MKNAVLLVLFLIPFLVLSQAQVKFKKKYLGKYTGNVPGFVYVDGGQEIAVRSTPINIEITKDSVFVNVGNQAVKGVYNVLFKAKTYYLLECTIEGQLSKEKILVYKRGRKISRDGIYPQPVTELKKTK